MKYFTFAHKYMIYFRKYFLYKTCNNFCRFKSSTELWNLIAFHRVEFNKSNIQKRQKIILSKVDVQDKCTRRENDNIVVVKRIWNNGKLQSTPDKDFEHKRL